MDFISAFLYKPRRILYYINPTEEEKADYLKGMMPEKFSSYDGAYGTYCSPSLFVISENGEKKEVIGMEYRPEDSLVEYPSDMASLEMKPCFMMSAVLPMPDYFSGMDFYETLESIRKNIENITYHNDNIKAKKQPGLYIVNTVNGSGKAFFECEEVDADTFFCKPELVTEIEKKLYEDAYHDDLTGHYNWKYIWPVIAGYGLLKIQDFQFVHFDIKDYKAINVVYGHDVANDVLRQVVDKMREEDWIYESARCDNDNFVMMIRDMPLEETIDKLKKFYESISELKEDSNYHIYYRCGLVPMKTALLLGDRVADAGKHVQRMGNKYYETEVIVYTDEMNDMLDWSEKTKAYLDTAIDRDEFLVYLQPKYDIRTNRLYGAEALIRWKFHGRELLNPAQFIPIFETGGLISKLDDIVLGKVCGYLKNWKEEGKTLYPISVNLSRKSLGNPNLTGHLTGIIDSYGVDHSLIEFELTESATYDNQEYMISVLKELKAEGFKISMDDFGTGYSSLSLLTVMPLDTIKIDKSFVDNIGDHVGNEKDRAVIKQIINMAKNLNFTCLAEGVEEKDQVDVLWEYGCEVIQGFYFSRPLPVDEYVKKIS